MKQIISICFLLFAISAYSQNVNNNMYTLSQNLRLDNDFEGGYGGRVVFDQDSVFIYVEVSRVDAKAKEITLSYSVLRVLDTVNIYPNFYTFEIERRGWETDTLKNEKKYNKYLSDKATLESELEALRTQLETIPQDSTELIRLQYEAISAKETEYFTLKEVEPKYIWTDRYNDVMTFYIDNSTLTPAGKQWVKGLPFRRKKTLAEFVN